METKLLLKLLERDSKSRHKKETKKEVKQDKDDMLLEYLKKNL